eukprot:CAMPEP_0184469882 /NCGR_PEP_ID=MMETSP0740-20130409/88615_1 /TAXON_ID=385413 /ORGANISM="Thalassiosira miniscula, Strain CCMP1093" /LENGTH=104 /DNA_ID=CAMNT_0026845913 /DNA_START=253 /DNA_END=568 /DNA_ORIENTATION=+
MRFTRAANREAANFQSRLADADRHRLSGFAAGADAVIHGEVVADHLNLAERGWAVADQRCVLDRRDDFSILHQIGFGALEDEIARSDVDLTTAKIDGPNAFFDR